MYLISLYFDNKSAMKIQGIINKVEAKSGNIFMRNTFEKIDNIHKMV